MRERAAAPHPFRVFDEVRVINLVDRTDRRREMGEQLERLGTGADNISYFDARRPDAPGGFPSIGARGCFESHLAVLTAARDRGINALLLLEDDLQFTRDGAHRLDHVLSELAHQDWSFFYGAHVLPANERVGLVHIPAKEPIITASCVGFKGQVISELVAFLEAMRLRPAGSPDYGPMHVDGAYSVFRELHPGHRTFAAFPSLGRQRSSLSDITPSRMVLDRWSGTRQLAALLRRGYNWMRWA